MKNKETLQSQVDEVLSIKIEPQVQKSSLEIKLRESEDPKIDEQHFSKKEMVAENNAMKKNTKLFSCAFCEETFTKRFSLKIHETIHTS